MVAGKSDHKDFGICKILERPVAPVNPGEIEFGGSGAKLQRGEVVRNSGLIKKYQACKK
jgi:hypothetical protein